MLNVNHIDLMEDVLFEKLKSRSIEILEKLFQLLVVLGSNLTEPSCDLTSV
jgi:hypothetical protein